VVLDLSSFKCGNDAPTYGLVDNIVAAGNTPYSALHDIDANKPGGSIKIRVRTYEYTLRRHAEDLQALAAKRSELERLVDAKRRELYERRRVRLEQLIAEDPRERQHHDSLQAAYASYLGRDPPLRSGRGPEPDRGACAPAAPGGEIVLPWPQLRQRPTNEERVLERSGT
jgi:hypothetical protein